MMQNLEAGPYAANKKAFYDMIYNNGNGMVPMWSSGVSKYIERINSGPDGLRPVMR